MARCGRGSGEVSDFPSSAMTCGCGPEVIVRREARVSTRENDPSQAWQRRRRAGTARNRAYASRAGLRPRAACVGGWKAEGYGGGGGSERWGFDARCARSDCSGFSFACWRSGLGFLAPRIGRDGEIRTHDPQHPMLVRYQTALRPDRAKNPHCNRAAPGWRAGRRVSGAGCTGLPRVRGAPA